MARPALAASDAEIFDHAVAEGFTVVTADSDFPMLLALRRAGSPSVIHLRHAAELGSDGHTQLLLANLPTIAAELERGVVVSLSPTWATEARAARPDVERAPDAA